MPLQLPAPRWALTPPFHPYRPKPAVSFLLRYPSHLAVRPGVTRSPVLRRPDFPHSRADPGCAAIRRALQLQFGEAMKSMQARIEVSAACAWGGWFRLDAAIVCPGLSRWADSRIRVRCSDGAFGCWPSPCWRLSSAAGCIIQSPASFQSRKSPKKRRRFCWVCLQFLALRQDRKSQSGRGPRKSPAAGPIRSRPAPISSPLRIAAQRCCSWER